jgi:hypothetical protein
MKEGLFVLMLGLAVHVTPMLIMWHEAGIDFDEDDVEDYHRKMTLLHTRMDLRRLAMFDAIGMASWFLVAAGAGMIAGKLWRLF